MGKNYLIFMLSVLSLISSCTKDKLDSFQSENGIVGKWIWVKSEGGICYHTETPEESGIERIFLFKESDTVEKYENNKLIHKTDYFFSKERSILYHDTLEFLTINYKYQISNPDSIVTIPTRYIIRKITDTLLLEEDIFDGYKHTYKREQE